MAEAEAGGDNMEAEAVLADPLLLLTMNLLRVALHNITYVRGLFPENCFIDKSIPEIGTKFKMLVHMDHESRRFIEWLEKGVSDALKKKYLKTLLFCICEEGEIIEEYAFSFRYPTLYNEDITMNVNLTGSGEKSTTFKSNAAEVTPHRMRSIACKLIRTLVSLMSTLEELPDQRTIQMMLLYYDADIPGDYEPPLFECCADAAGNNKPLRMEARSANMKDLLLALKPEDYDDPAFGCCANSAVNNKPLKMEVGSTNSKDIVLASKINTEDGNTSLITDYKPHEALSLCEARLVRKFELCCISRRRPVFLLDSGASFHICNNKAYMKNLKPIPEEKQRMLDGINGEVYVAKEMGSVAFEDINVRQVMFIPEVAFNVFSVGQFDQQGLLILLTGGLFMILDVDNAVVIGEGYRHLTNNDYVVKGINWVRPDTEETSDVNHPEIEPDKEWIIDSCAACHMTFKKELLINIRTCKEKYQTPKGTISSTHRGDVKIENLTLSKVQYSPKATRSLISVPSLEAEGHRFTFYQSKCGIVLKSTFRQCGSGVRDPRDNLYYLTEFNPKKDITVVASAATTSTKRKWDS